MLLWLLFFALFANLSDFHLNVNLHENMQMLCLTLHVSMHVFFCLGNIFYHNNCFSLLRCCIIVVMLEI